jgi:hypothetical protein
MRALYRESAASGFITPHELMAVVGELVQVAHGIDRDNLVGENSVTLVANAITSAKLALDTMGSVVWDDRGTAQDSELTETHALGSEYPIPADDGEPWRITFECQDGMLAATFNVTFDVLHVDGLGDSTAGVWVGVRLDGNLVAQSPPGDWPCTSDTVECSWACPVPAGSHTLELVYGYAVLIDASKTVTITWNEGVVFGEVATR